ncbi:hypothetical protein [Methylocapsa acidiphila]|uniref:hypothetical protein n=1 Tax=Methylocapsa acidiphila TaxID=133552 RepID=UPI0012EB6A85|nr:hypothetical protein [Methylocapsa acidiphila]
MRTEAMHTRVGNCFIEYIRPAQGTPEVLHRFPFWSGEPNANYFRSLAEAGVKSFYRAAPPNVGELWRENSRKKIYPEAVRIVNDDGVELCRWTADDEFESVQLH